MPPGCKGGGGVLILAGDKALNLGVGEHWPITAHIDITNIAPAALTYSALHSFFQGSYHLLRSEAQFFQYGEGKSYHDWRSTNDSYGILA